jgi:hypothetical protein
MPIKPVFFFLYGYDYVLSVDGSLPALRNVNWFEDRPPRVIFDRDLPRFLLPNLTQLEDSKMSLPDWLTTDVWKQAENVFALPPVSKNYPEDNVEKVFQIDPKDFSGIPVFLEKEHLSSFSTDWNSQPVISEGREERVKKSIDSLPCIVFSFNGGPSFRIPAAHHQLFAMWFVERGCAIDFKDVDLLDWETKKNNNSVSFIENSVFLFHKRIIFPGSLRNNSFLPE